MLYISGAMQDKYKTSFPFSCEILDAEDLRLIAAGTDYCMAEFRNGFTSRGEYRRSHCAAEDFVQSDVLYADIDNDGCIEATQFTIEAFDNIFHEYEYFLTTSKSHRKQKDEKPPLDRFHVFFPLDQPVTDRETMKGYLQSLHKHFFGMKVMDSSCIDVARKFYGNPSNEAKHNAGKSIQAIIDQLWRRDQIEAQKVSEFIRGKSISPANSITDPMRQLIIPSLDKAYKLGWFDEYRSWINLAMALKQAGYKIDVWHRYCHTSDDIELAEKKWETLSPDGSLNGMQYLYAIHQKLNFTQIRAKSGGTVERRL